MAKLTRQILKQFGAAGSTTNFAEVGSLTAGSPVKSKALATIQGLAAWDNGWQDIIFGANKDIALEDLNGVFYVSFYQLFYLLQEGIPEYKDDTVYWIGSYAKRPGTNELYTSLTDNNTGNGLPTVGTDNANWSSVYPVRTSQLSGSIVNSQITSLDASKITSQLVSAQIASVTASVITGQLVDAQIQSLAASKITGTIGDAQISGLSATKITGTIGTAQIAAGAVTDSKIVTVDASKISGSILSLATLVATSSLKFGSGPFEMLKILQIQIYTTNTEAAISGTSFTNTNLTGNFTPKIASSKVLLLAAGNMSQTAGDIGYATIYRDGVNLAPTSAGFHATLQNNNYFINMITVDAPGTTAAVTYAVRMRTQGGGSFCKFPLNNGGSAGVPAGVLIAIEFAV